MQRVLLTRAMGVLAILWGVMASPGSAWADYAMLVVMGGDSSANGLARSRAEQYLEKAGFDVLSEKSAVQVGVSIKAVARCMDDDAECMKDALITAQVDRLLLIELGEERDRKRSTGLTVVVRLFDGLSGERLRIEQHRCDAGCQSDGSLGTIIDQLCGTMLEIKVREPEQTAETCWLEVQTTPPQAMVSIDGKTMGPSGRAYQVAPGNHTVRVELDGYSPSERAVEVASNQTKIIHLDLAAIIGGIPSEGGGYGAVKWLALGGGLGLAALGVAGIAVDGPRFDENNNRLPEQWATLPYGIAATAVGAALIGVSGYMFYQDATGTREAGMVFELGNGRAGIGFAGAF